MATRSHIRFTGKSLTDKQTTVQLFKFHDGNPAYMLEHFKDFFSKCRNFSIEEIVPSFITYTKILHREDKTIKEFLNSEWHDLNLEIYLTEVSDDLPRDIEWFYKINLDTQTIEDVYSEKTYTFESLEEIMA